MLEKISFTKTIKEELTKNNYKEGETRSLLAAFIKVNGMISFSNDGEKLTLRTENANIAKFIYSLLKERYPRSVVSFSFVRAMKLYKSTAYLINVIDGVAIDLACEQFGENAKNLVYENNPIQPPREERMSQPGKRERYELLKQNLERWCACVHNTNTKGTEK